MKQKILDALEKKNVLILDGAMGSNLFFRGLPPGTLSEEWLLDKPEEIIGLQSDFVASGSDILLTCTFCGSPLLLGQHGMEPKTELINQAGEKVAREAFGDKKSLVCGSIGPCGQMLAPYGTLQEAELLESTKRQATALVDAGVDLIVIETQFDLNEAAVGVKAVREVSEEIFLVVSFSYDRGRKTMMGVTSAAMAEKFNELDVDALGINCGKSVEENLENLKELAENTDKLLWFKPNAGLPETLADGSSQYNVDEAEYKVWIKQAVEIGAHFIGGCCGTSPEYLGYIKDAVRG